MKNILVTGGAGFIGSSLCEALLKKGNKIFVIDNFNEYYDPAIKKRNIEEIKETMTKNNIIQGNFNLYVGDIRNEKTLNDIFANKIDMVIHLAAMAGVRYSIQNPELYYDVNVMGTLKLLEKCKQYKIAEFLFASSSSVYGNNKKVPFSETDNVDFPISPYAATKKAGELLCHTYSHLYNIKIACLRFFTVYGPRQRPDLAIYKFTKLIEEDKEIPFYGEGDTQRDYTYIDDIVDGIISAAQYIDENKVKYEIFNLGGDHTVSLKEMVNTIEKELCKNAIIKRMPMQPGDVNITYADLNKSHLKLDYSPKINFKEGIAKFVKWKKMRK